MVGKQQILGQRQLQLRIAGLLIERAAKHFRGQRIVFQLLVDIGQAGEAAGVGVLVGHFAQHVGRGLVVAQIGIHGGQAGHGVFIVGVQFQRLLISGHRFGGVHERLLQTAQHDPTLDILGIGLGDLLVLLNGLLHHFGIDLVGLRIADQVGIDARQQPARVQIVGVLFECVFSVQHRLAQPSGLDV